MSVAILIFSFVTSEATAQPRLDLDGDTDRTGKIEGTQSEEDLEPTSSVIVINNCDCDAPAAGTSPQPDHSDETINGVQDLLDTEPIILRRFQVPAGARVSLRVTAHSKDDVPLLKRIRVFAHNGREVIGPNLGADYTLTSDEVAQLADSDLMFYLEGLSFSTTAKLAVFLDEQENDTLLVEVAPFIFTPQSLAPRRNFVVFTGDADSQEYVKRFQAACSAAAVPAIVVNSIDRWMEDELTLGYTESPRRRLTVAFHMLRQRQLATSVRQMLAPDVGWFQAFDYPVQWDNRLTYGGNVEVTPPSHKFPFGRVYYGSKVLPDDAVNKYRQREFDKRFRAFFDRHHLQPAIELHTNWLDVGHVDEVIAFVPKGDGQGYALLAASPRLALDLLRIENPATPLDPKYGMFVPGLQTVGDLFTAPTMQRTLEQYNLDVDDKIFGPDHQNPDPESVVGTLRAALGDPIEVVEIPTLFINNDDAVWGALALTPGMVNLSSMGSYSLVPEPFLPSFKTRVRTAFQAIQQQPLWIDNWYTYHVFSGEVHCGSNMERNGFASGWWK